LLMIIAILSFKKTYFDILHKLMYILLCMLRCVYNIQCINDG